MDVATNARRLADRNTATLRQAVDRAASASQAATRRVQTGYSLLTLGGIDYQRKLLEIAQENVNIFFDYAQDLTNAGSVSELVEISNRYARQQLSTISEQARELAVGFQTLTGDVARQFSGMTSIIKGDR
jgi:hypothetical protein